MAQDYNVDDILEEIRRKKSREAGDYTPPPRDTYGGEDDYRQALPPARQRSRAPEPDGPPRPARREPAPRRACQDEPAPRERRPSREAPEPEDRRAAREGYPDIAPLGSRRPSRPSAFPPRGSLEGLPAARRRAAGEEPPQRPARSPYGGAPAPLQNRADDRPARPASRTQRYEEDPMPASPRRPREEEPPPRGQFSFRLPEEGPESGFGFDAEPADAAPPGDGFGFGLPEDGGDGFRLPLFDDAEEEPAPRYERPREDGTRMDLPRTSRMQDAAGFTQEIDAQPQAAPHRARREERPQEALVESKWRQAYAEQLRLEAEAEDDDFASPEDAPYVAKDIRAIRTGLRVKCAFTLLLALASLYLAVSLRASPVLEKLGLKHGLLPLPGAIAPENNMRLFLIVNLVLCVLAAIICSNIVGGGIASLCRLRGDCDSPAALAVLAVLIQGIVLAVFPASIYEGVHISLYFPVALFVLVFGLIGKQMLIARVERNFKTLTSDKEKYALVQVLNREFAREFARGLGPDVDRVAYSAKTAFVTGFLDRSYSPDYSGGFTRFAAPISFLLGIVVGTVTFVLSKQAPIAVSAFTAVLCICAPLSGSILPNLMLNRVSKRLAGQGAMLAGYEAAEEFNETGAVVVSDKDLFSPDSIMLHGMKVFAEKRIDDAILDAASVIISCDGIMSGVFLNMVGGNRRMLKKVDSLMYEDGMGLSAWVDGKRVLIGSHELMRTHGIDCPSRDFESRYVRDGRQVLYIANSGELSAMFVVSYNADPATAEALAELERRGISAAVYSTDPNITSELIALTFGIKRSSVRVLPAKLHPDYANLTRPKPRISAGGVHGGGVNGVLQLLKAARAVRRSVMNGAVVQLIGSIVGYGLVTMMAFTGSLSMANFGTLILFGLAWLVVTGIAASLTK